MKKRMIACLLSGIMVVGTITGCGDSSNNGKTKASEEVSSEDTVENDTDDESVEPTIEADTSWYSNNPGAISSGMFVVGKDIKAGNYTYTVDYKRLDDTYSQIYIFESEDTYMKYYQSDKSYGSDYDTYMSYVLSKDGCKTGESMAANLVDGNVIVLSDTQGTLTGDSVDTSKTKLTSDKGKQYAHGLYQPGTFKSGTYIACNNSSDEDDGRMSIVLFNSMDDYKSCENEAGASAGDWQKALEKYAYYNYVTYPGESVTFNVRDNTVVLIDYGTAFIQQVDMGWSVD